MDVRHARLGEHGFELIPGLLGEDLLYGLPDLSANRRGILEDFPEIAALASSRTIKDALRRTSGRECFVVRGILFDKAEDANWHVRWHQDRAIAVKERCEVDGFTGWSVKDGVPHVLAPASVLESMVSIRLHLDDAPTENGALRVLAGSHRHGLLDTDARDEMKEVCREVICVAGAGDALVIRPLLLHSSLSATEPRHRRVIHLECATEELPGELEWH